MTETEKRVVAIIRDEFGCDVTDLDMSLSDVTRLGAGWNSALRLDSLDLVQFVVACEEEFALLISDDEADLVTGSTVRQWCAFIDARLTAAKVLAGSVAA